MSEAPPYAKANLRHGRGNAKHGYRLGRGPQLLDIRVRCVDSRERRLRLHFKSGEQSDLERASMTAR